MKRYVDAGVHCASFKQPCRNDDTPFNSNERAGAARGKETRKGETRQRALFAPTGPPKTTAGVMRGSARASGERRLRHGAWKARAPGVSSRVRPRFSRLEGAKKRKNLRNLSSPSTFAAQAVYRRPRVRRPRCGARLKCRAHPVDRHVASPKRKIEKERLR